MTGITRYYENDGITTKVEWKFVGYGIDAQAVYSKSVTTFGKFYKSFYKKVLTCLCVVYNKDIERDTKIPKIKGGTK